MIRWLTDREVWLYREPLDFRKQMNGLIQTVVTDMETVPNNGAVYIFRNRAADKIKILLWERNGFFMGCKRLETGRFKIPKQGEGPLKLSWEEVYLLISGLPVEAVKTIPQAQVTHFF